MDAVRNPTNCGLLIQRLQSTIFDVKQFLEPNIVTFVAGRFYTAMSLISEAIEDKLDVDHFLASSNSINIADLGCSLAFVAVKNIVESSLPPNRQYFAAGVPGSIHGRLFPKGALHIVNSSYALYWLSKIPDELVDKDSPSFNKGKIFYTNSGSKVVEAYAAQFARDMEAFLNARAEELVSGGLVALLLPCFRSQDMPACGSRRSFRRLSHGNDEHGNNLV
ncbi:hypothetical protein OSB04_000490 [Centaurea solstitialis]|uniref:Uncharacterized protein n=1 Tax=Centaurea solstitialis TaxID=347529 RepID=A0AA38TPC9_9ASTR|nr:hypothetical protein OSB04_000490 [Centaurea solstitialis]